MDIYLKVTAGIIVAVIAGLVLSRQSADLSLLLTIGVCCLVIVGAFSYLQPVMDFLKRLAEVGNISNDLLGILLKVAGIGMISQITEFICTDAGNRTMVKALQIMTAAVILCLCVPILEQMLTLIEKVMGEI